MYAQDIRGGAARHDADAPYFATAEKLQKFTNEWRSFLLRLKAFRTPSRNSGSAPTLADLARVNGQVASLLNEVHGIKAEGAPLIQLMAEEVRNQWTARAQRSSGSSAFPFRVRYSEALTRAIPDSVIEALETLTDGATIAALNGTRIRQFPMRWAMVVDSDKRARSYFFGKSTSRPRPQSKFFALKTPQTRFFSMRWRNRHSVYAEPAGAALAIMEEVTAKDIRDCHIVVYTDSSTAKAAINHGGSKSETVSRIFAELKFFQFLRERGVTVTAEHMRGVEMIANGTDGASRPTKLMVGELQMSQAMVEILQKWCGHSVSVDMMASPQNAVVPRFIGRTFSPEAAGVDAWTQDWRIWWQRYRRILFAFPPPGRHSISRTLERVEAAQVPVLLILPLDVSSSSVRRALQISNFLPYLWIPSQETVAYPLESALRASLRGRTVRRSTSSSDVWMALTLFVPMPPAGCGLVPWTRPLPPASRSRWIRSLKTQRTEAGERSFTSAVTSAEIAGARQMSPSATG